MVHGRENPNNKNNRFQSDKTYGKGSSNNGATRLILAQLTGRPASLYSRVMIVRNGSVLLTHSISPPFSLSGMTA